MTYEIRYALGATWVLIARIPDREKAHAHARALRGTYERIRVIPLVEIPV